MTHFYKTHAADARILWLHTTQERRYPHEKNLLRTT